MSEPATRRTLFAVVWWDTNKGDGLPLKLGQLFGPFKTATQARKAAAHLAGEARPGVYAQVIRLVAWWDDDPETPVSLTFDRLLDSRRLAQLTRQNKELKARVAELEEKVNG